jgi:uncharacterized protein (DUF2164 family)
MAIEIPDETRRTLIASIRRYFAEEMDEEIGDLKASLLLDFVLQEVGPTVYNGAIADAQARMQERVVDLDGICYEPELTYWKK